MKRFTANATVIAAQFLIGAAVQAQPAGPAVSPTSLSFSYSVNSTTLPVAAKVTAALPTSLSSYTLSVSSDSAWLTATPEAGRSPLALTVAVNPTGLGPGNYQGKITVVTSPSTTAATVAVTLLVSNPPSKLTVSSPAFPAGSTSLTYNYTTGGTLPSASTIYVASTGDVIPFNVTAAAASSGGSGASSSSKNTAVWLRVGQGNSLTTSGVALSGSFVPIQVSLDATTVSALDPGSYNGTVTIAATNAANGTLTVAVTLVVAAGAPVVNSMFPATFVAAPAIDPVVTIYGDNFFATSAVSIQFGTNQPINLPAPTLLSRKVLQASIKASYLTFTGAQYPISGTLLVTNPPPADNPGQLPAQTTFNVVDPSLPNITSVVNAGSFLPTAVFTGTGSNPAQNGKSVAPREIISIFGQNLGPATVTTASPAGTPPVFPTSVANVQVQFQGSFGGVMAPIIMVSSNQINCIVPVEVAAVVGSATDVIVINGGVPTTPVTLSVVREDPGVFTFGGLGLGQAAVLNYDTSAASYSINGSKNAALKGSPIVIYATGLGDLASSNPPIGSGDVTSSVVLLNDQTVRVDIDGQPAAVTYAGTSPGAVAGLVQINAVVPQKAKTGATIPVVVSIGDPASTRQSQAGVMIAVK